MVTRIDSFTAVDWKSSCTPLRKALQTQPIAVAVNAQGWNSYSSGIFNNNCDIGGINHAVLLVGWNK